MNYLIDPSVTGVDPCGTLIFAHGAGALMDSNYMQLLTAELNAAGVAVVRFEFPYMQQRREIGKKRPPDRQPILLNCWRQVYEEISGHTDLPLPLLIGGKSMGGRMASLVADELGVSGLCCFGYPFHPVKKPEKMRTEHLLAIKTPTFIFQGTRDPLGKPDELSDIIFSEALNIRWLKDGDHDLKPRKSSGLTQLQHLKTVAAMVADFALSLGGKVQTYSPHHRRL
ncbi:MAG: alpha/beta hydrolase [Porticoccus sp.]|nr:alpha/beta hydrolase [Porticoccus sp.]